MPGPEAARDAGLVEQCLDLYGNHYGRWGKGAGTPGARVRISEAAFRKRIDHDNVWLACAFKDDLLSASASPSEATWRGKDAWRGSVCWWSTRPTAVPGSQRGCSTASGSSATVTRGAWRRRTRSRCERWKRLLGALVGPDTSGNGTPKFCVMCASRSNTYLTISSGTPTAAPRRVSTPSSSSIMGSCQGCETLLLAVIDPGLWEKLTTVRSGSPAPSATNLRRRLTTNASDLALL